MHRGRMGALFIDHPPMSFPESLAFWTAATGRAVENRADPNDPYGSLGRFSGELLVELQRVGEGTTPRVHLDLETDDVEAEVRRLERVGGTPLGNFPDGHWQLADPGGLVFCVIPPHTPDFVDRATVWP